MDYVNELFNACVQYVLTGAVCVLCAFLGIKLRQMKNKKNAANAEE